MKKLISIFLTVSILSALLAPLNLFAMAEETAIQSFIDDSINLINRTPDNNIVLNSGETTGTNSAFETCRLIVKSNKKPNELNSIGMVSGFKDYYIIQFKNEDDTEVAFNYYSEHEYIISVYPDEKISLSEFEINETATNKSDVTPERLNSWGGDSTGLYELKDYLVNNSICMDEVDVAVIDSGVDLEHEFLQDRLIETGFNSAEDGTENSEMDLVDGHGTSVASVIVDLTPDNVKIQVYRVLDETGNGTVLTVTLGFLQAIANNVKVINASVGLVEKAENSNDILFDAVKTAYEKNITVVASSGNNKVDIEAINTAPANSDYTITVNSNNVKEVPSTFTNHGSNVDISAPGDKVPVALLNNEYGISSGTSFSAPYVTATCAIICSLFPHYGPNDMKDLIKSTATPYDNHVKTQSMYGVGILDAIGASVLTRADKVNTNIVPGKYEGKISVELTSESSNEIYYSLDNTVPTKENGILYTQPIEIENDEFVIKAVAYENNVLRSSVFSGEYHAFETGKEEDFVIDDYGTILSYGGDIKELIIPEKINDITVKDIADGAFDLAQIYCLYLPDTVTKLTGGFYQNSTVLHIWGDSVTELGDSVFYNSKVNFIDMPKLEKVGCDTFFGTSDLRGVNFPELREVGDRAFYASKIWYAYLPKLEKSGYGLFYGCDLLYNIDVSDLTTTTGNHYRFKSCLFKESNCPAVLNLENLESVSNFDFYDSYFERVEFSNLKTLNSYPTTLHSTSKITMVLPVTLEEITVNKEYADGKGIYTIYGSKDTLAEQWANENGFKFIEITPETAVITDLPQYYKLYMGELEADVVGFNRQYQWFANTVNSNEGGIPIEGATNKTFNPSDYPAQYYYCVVTSTDKGFDPVVIKTSACENRATVADYTKVNEAIAKVPTDLSKYTAESRLNLENAINAVDKNLSISEQAQVDAMAKAIEEAISALELMPAEVFMVEAVIQMTCGESRKLTVVCDEKVTFESSDTSVATVDENGVVTAVGKGTATITVTAGDKTDTCIIEVKFTFCRLIMYWFNNIVDFIVNCILFVR